MAAPQFRLFIIGLPGVGKTTASRFLAEYLRRNLPATKIAKFDDYELLITKPRDSGEHRISLNGQGQFTIEEKDRDQVLSEVLQSLRSQAAASKAEICLLEFSRFNYVKAIQTFDVKDNYAIIYLRTDDLPLRMQRNRSRAPDQQIRTIPDEVMKLHSCSTDDVAQLTSLHPGRLLEIDTSKLTLNALRDEVNLRAREILQSRFRFEEAIPLWQELVLFSIVLIQCVVGLAVLFCVWAIPKLPNLCMETTARWLLSYSALRMYSYAACGGWLGATAYSIRCLRRYSVLKILDFQAYRWWYLLGPLEAALLASGIYAILNGGIATLGARFDNARTGQGLAILGLSFLIGVSTEAFMEWLVALAKKLTNYRVQPPEYQDAQESPHGTRERTND